MITLGEDKLREKILHSELIGNHIEIIDAENKSLIGKKGKIIFETRNTLVLQDKNKHRKTLIKSQVVFNLNQGNKTYQVNGKVLVGRPEDRLKKPRRLK